jgi:hypothetical protein
MGQTDESDRLKIPIGVRTIACSASNRVIFSEKEVAGSAAEFFNSIGKFRDENRTLAKTAHPGF